MVCGEALMDVIRTPAGGERAMPGGSPFNTARALGRLGVPVGFLGRLSEDRFGRELTGLLAADGVSLALTSTGPERTTLAVAEIDAGGVARYRFEVEGTSAPQLTGAALPPGATTVVVGSLGLVLEPMASTLIDLVGRQHGGRVVVLDPNVRPGLVADDEYRGRLHRVIAESTVVKASRDDLAWIYPGLDHEAAAARLLGEGVRLVAITLGAEGAFAATGDVRVAVPALPVQVADTIGAGDAFGAALLAWLHDRGRLELDLRVEPAELREALAYACRAAAITCSRAGANPPTRAELAAT